MSDTSKAFTVRIPSPQHAKIKRIEERSGRTMADIIRDAIDRLPDPVPIREDGQAAVE